MGKLDTEGNELDRAKRLIRILEELVNSEFVPEGNELEIVELLIRILKELLARVLDAKEREIEAEARLNEEEDDGAAADEKVELDANVGGNDDVADADELEPGAESKALLLLETKGRDDDAAKVAEELGRPKIDVEGEMLLLTGTDEIIAGEEVPASVVLGRPEFIVRDMLLEMGADGIVNDGAGSSKELENAAVEMLL
jgi:hypothetical protein